MFSVPMVIAELAAFAASASGVPFLHAPAESTDSATITVAGTILRLRINLMIIVQVVSAGWPKCLIASGLAVVAAAAVEVA
jgi:hypothetical protein